MKKKPLIVGGITFPSVPALVAYTKLLMERNKKLNSGEDFDFFIDLFKRHPDWERKNGTGIISIKIFNDPNQSFQIWVTRSDGSRSAISWKKSCKGRGYSERTERIRAYRVMIKKQTNDFRIKMINVKHCEKCEIKFQESPHVDHTPSFVKLVDAFEKQHLIQTFRDFHRIHARLTLLCKDCNIEKGRTE